VTEMERLAAQRRQRKDTRPAAPDGHEWGTCQSVHRTGRSRARTVVRVLLASGFVVTAYLTPGLVAPAVNAPVLVDHVAGGDSPKGDIVVVDVE
jgi:hypothetical protein